MPCVSNASAPQPLPSRLRHCLRASDTAFAMPSHRLRASVWSRAAVPCTVCRLNLSDALVTAVGRSSHKPNASAPQTLPSPCVPTAPRQCLSESRASVPCPMCRPLSNALVTPADRALRHLNRRRDSHSAAPPSPFSRRFNADEESAEWQKSRQWLVAP